MRADGTWRAETEKKETGIPAGRKSDHRIEKGKGADSGHEMEKIQDQNGDGRGGYHHQHPV